MSIINKASHDVDAVGNLEVGVVVDGEVGKEHITEVSNEVSGNDIDPGGKEVSDKKVSGNDGVTGVSEVKKTNDYDDIDPDVLFGRGPDSDSDDYYREGEKTVSESYTTTVKWYSDDDEFYDNDEVFSVLAAVVGEKRKSRV